MTRDARHTRLGPTGDAGLTMLDEDEILAVVRSGARRLDRQIRLRDWRELIAGLVAAVLVAPAAAHGPIVGRLGAIVILGGLVLLVVRLRRARCVGGASGADPSLPVAHALDAELRRVDAQIGLLESVGWWYVTPLLGGSVLLVAGRSGGRAPGFLLGYGLVAVLFGWGIVVLNRTAARRALQPKREQLKAMLEELGT